MITEDYVSFDTAKLLKEKGFDDECANAFYDKAKNLYFMDLLSDLSDHPDNDTDIAASTLYVAMKWLREVHNKIIVPGISLDDRTSCTINHYIVGIWYIPENNGGAFCYTSPTPYGGYPSFEKACEAGIKYCIENLI